MYTIYKNAKETRERLMASHPLIKGNYVSEKNVYVAGKTDI